MNTISINGNYDLLKLSSFIHGEGFITDFDIRNVNAKILDCSDLWYLTNIRITNSNINTIFFVVKRGKLTIKKTTYVSIVIGKHFTINEKKGKTIVKRKFEYRVDTMPSLNVRSLNSLPEALIRRLLTHALITLSEDQIPYLFGWLKDSNLLTYKEYDRPYIEQELYLVDKKTADELKEMIEEDDEDYSDSDDSSYFIE